MSCCCCKTTLLLEIVEKGTDGGAIGSVVPAGQVKRGLNTEMSDGAGGTFEPASNRYLLKKDKSTCYNVKGGAVANAHGGFETFLRFTDTVTNVVTDYGGMSKCNVSTTQADFAIMNSESRARMYCLEIENDTYVELYQDFSGAGGLTTDLGCAAGTIFDEQYAYLEIERVC